MIDSTDLLPNKDLQNTQNPLNTVEAGGIIEPGAQSPPAVVIPSVVANAVPDSPFPAQPQTPPENTHKKFGIGFLKSKVLLIIVFLLIVSGVSAGIFKYVVNTKVTSYTLLPEDSQFYLALSVKNHPQVKKLLALGHKFPGGEKMIKYVDGYRQELFSKRKDPFKEILDLAESEIFLAKVSSDEQEINSFSVNPLEQLVNIVEFKNSKFAKDNLITIQNNDQINASKEAYGSASIAKLDLKSQSKTDTSTNYKTGALPYQVTLPLSKSIFATTIDNFIVSAEKESDVKKVLDVVTKSKDKKIKSISEDKDHQEIVKNFPSEYLVKFYQKQVQSPFSNAGLTALPTTAFGSSKYDTTERATEGDNVFNTKGGLTIVAKDNGVDFTSYQLTNKNMITEGLKHGFTFADSLASKLPSTFNKNHILFYGELRDLKGTFDDQIAQFKDIAKNSSDTDQKEAYAEIIKGMEEAKVAFKKTFDVDVDEDILSWMNKNVALVVTTGSGGDAPEILFIFEVDNITEVEQKLSKLKIPDINETANKRTGQARDAKLKNDIGALATELQGYYTTPGAGKYPQSLNELLKQGYLKQLPKTANNEDYIYFTCLDNKEAAVFGKLEVTGTYWGWSSERGQAGDTGLKVIPQTCNFTVDNNYEKYTSPLDLPKISPKADAYKDSKIYTFPIYDYTGDTWGLRYTFMKNLVIFSVGVSDSILKQLLDENTTSKIVDDSVWKEQFKDTSAVVGSIVYIVPENLLGIFDYATAKSPSIEESMNSEPRAKDALTIFKGYIKTIRSIGSTVTQRDKTIINNTFINIKEIDPGEMKEVEAALDRVLEDKRLSPSNVLGADSTFDLQGMLNRFGL